LEENNNNRTAPEDKQRWNTEKEKHGARDWAKKESLQAIGVKYYIEKQKAVKTY
jgi:hypothetical protein